MGVGTGLADAVADGVAIGDAVAVGVGGAVGVGVAVGVDVGGTVGLPDGLGQVPGAANFTTKASADPALVWPSKLPPVIPAT